MYKTFQNFFGAHVSCTAPMFLIGVTYLDLSMNNIATIDNLVFSGLTQMSHLLLSENSLTTVPPIPSDVAPALVYLALDNNLITEIPDNYFQDFATLEYLDLQYNKLTALDEFALTGLVSLLSLDIGHNDINFMHQDVFKDTGQLQYFYAGDNPGGSFPCFAPYINDSLQYLSFYGGWKVSSNYEECVTGLTGG